MAFQAGIARFLATQSAPHAHNQNILEILGRSVALPCPGSKVHLFPAAEVSVQPRTPMNSRSISLFSFLALFSTQAPALCAQDIPAIQQAGDMVSGVAGLLSSFDSVDVDNAGNWIIEARTSTPHQVLLSSTGVLGQEGDPLPNPPLASIVTWDGPRLNNLGDVAANILISGVDSTIYWNNVFQFGIGDFTTAPGFTAGSPYVDFREAWANDANQLMVVGSVDDPNLTQFFDSFVMVRDLDAFGAPISENVVVKVDDVLPGMTGIEKVSGIHTNGNHQYAINNSGDVIYGVDIFGPIAPNSNDAYYINNTTLVAREGQVEPLTGRVWKTLEDAVDINDNGDFAYKGRLSASGSGDWIIIKTNTTILAQEGGTIPAIAPHTFREFSQAAPSLGPVLIDNAGNVLWFGEWEDAMGVTQGRALFLNQDILVQEGVATSGGSGVLLFGDEFAMSDTGQYIIFTGLAGGTQSVFLMDRFDGFSELCNGDGGDQAGCTNCPCGNNSLPGTVGGCINSGGGSSRLVPSGIPSISMDSVHFNLTGAPGTAFCILNSGDNVAPTGMANPCFGLNSGVQSGNFDGLRCAVGNTLRHGGRSANASGEVGITNNGWGPPNGPMAGFAAQSGFVAGQTRYFQVIHRDDPLAVCGRGLNTSQAVEVLYFP